MAPAFPPELLQAYRATRVDVELPGGVLGIPAADEAPLADLPPELSEGAWIITAWNPGSRELGRPDNDARNAALAREIATLGGRCWPAWGRARDGEWAEASWVIVGLSRADALVLGARFGQNAIFWLDEDGLQVVPMP